MKSPGNFSDMHYIRRHILREVSLRKWARFRDMKPPRVDSNLYSYHLKQLIKEGYVERITGKGYRLSPYGLSYVNQISMETFSIRRQPKIITALVVKKDGKYLLWNKFKQPFIDKWSLPNGKVHFDDESIDAAARRDSSYFTNSEPQDLRHVGIVAYRVFIAGELITYTEAHVFTATFSDEVVFLDRMHWVAIETVSDSEIAPAVKQIIWHAEHEPRFFFKEYRIDW